VFHDEGVLNLGFLDFAQRFQKVVGARAFGFYGFLKGFGGFSFANLCDFTDGFDGF